MQTCTLLQLADRGNEFAAVPT